MSDLLHGRHPKTVEFLKALGVPNLGRVRSFKITVAIDDIVQVEIGYMVDADDIDCDTIYQNFELRAMDPEPVEDQDTGPVDQKDWPQTCLNG